MKKKTIIGVVTAILILGAGFGFYKWYQLSQVEALDLVQQKLCDLTVEAIKEIKIEGETSQTFIKKDNNWENEKHPTVSYNQGLINNIAYQISHLDSYKMAKNVKDITTYGIDENSKKVRVLDEAGTSATYWLGHRVLEENATFVWYEEKDELALVLDIDLASVMVPTSEMIEPHVIVPSVEEITKVELKQKGETQVLLTKQDSWIMEAPFSKAHRVQAEQVEQIETYLQVLETLRKEKLVEDENLNLENYGLQVPESQIILNDQYIFDFGSKIGSNIYFKMNGSDEVFEIQGSVESALQAITPFEWIDKQLYSFDRKQVSYIEVQYLEDVYRLQLKEAEQVPTLNGQLIEPSVKEEILKQVEALQIAKNLKNAKFEETNPRAAELIIRIGYLGGEEGSTEFVPYDPSFDLIREDGVIEFAAEKKPLLALVDYLKAQVKEASNS